MPGPQAIAPPMPAAPDAVLAALAPGVPLAEQREALRKGAWQGSLSGWPDALRDPTEAWEVLVTRELVPEAWLDAPRRRFVDAVPALRIETLQTVLRNTLGGQTPAARMGRVAAAVSLAAGAAVALAATGSSRRALANAAAQGAGQLLRGLGSELAEAQLGEGPRPRTMRAVLATASQISRLVTAEAMALEVFSAPHARVCWSLRPAGAGFAVRAAETRREARHVYMKVWEQIPGTTRGLTALAKLDDELARLDVFLEHVDALATVTLAYPEVVR